MSPGVAMVAKLQVLLIEDEEDDALLVLRELEKTFGEVAWIRVDTPETVTEALHRQVWDVIICDHSMPRLDSLSALAIRRREGIDTPFVIVSGTMGEEIAVQAMRAGASDYLLKDRLTRLCPVVERELRDAAVRRAKTEAEQSARRQALRFETLVNSMDDLVFTLDRDMRYTGVFGRWIEREGVPRTHLLGRTASEIQGRATGAIHQDAARRALLGESVTYEWTVDEPVGRRHFQTVLSPMREPDTDIVGVVGVGREITELRRAQAQLVVADRMVSVGLLAAGVAHEINNPLAAVIANLDVAKADLGIWVTEAPTPAAIRYLTDLVTDASTAAERIRQTASDLRLFSRADDERSGPIDVNEVIQSSLRMARTQVQHRAEIVAELGVLPKVDANESRLGQVILNLLVNAAQAIPEGQASDNEIRIRTAVNNTQQVVIEISDTGVGMPASVLDQLFTPFFSTKAAGVGMGLGLSICQRIITSFGGSITVESTPGKGSTFSVRLPASQMAPSPSTVREAETRLASRRGRILVVDDDPLVGRAVQRTLASEHDVMVLGSAREALANLAAGRRFDAILCDVMMRDLTGKDFYDEVARVTPDVVATLIFITGGVFTQSGRAFLDSIPNRWIEKPFDQARLRAVVNERIA